MKKQTSRREFLATSLLTGAALSACATTAVFRTVIHSGTITVKPEEISELSIPGKGVLISAEGHTGAILLVNLDGQTYLAISAVCTHLGCNLRFSRQFLSCPCHGSTFDLNGEVVRGPAQRSLRTFETRNSDGIVQIAIPG